MTKKGWKEIVTPLCFRGYVHCTHVRICKRHASLAGGGGIFTGSRLTRRPEICQLILVFAIEVSMATRRGVKMRDTFVMGGLAPAQKYSSSSHFSGQPSGALIFIALFLRHRKSLPVGLRCGRRRRHSVPAAAGANSQAIPRGLICRRGGESAKWPRVQKDGKGIEGALSEEEEEVAAASLW